MGHLTKKISLIKISNKYLKKGGLLLNVGWYDTGANKKEHEENLTYNFDTENGISIKKSLGLTEKGGFKLVKRGVFNVKCKKQYG